MKSAALLTPTDTVRHLKCDSLSLWDSDSAKSHAPSRVRLACKVVRCREAIADAFYDVVDVGHRGVHHFDRARILSSPLARAWIIRPILPNLLSRK